jgi:probable F420-dependent oxidoreductase
VDAGVTLFPTDETPQPADLARVAEDLGFESLWFPEHTHIPASRESPWPGGAELPREYTRALDPFVALAAAAAVTERLRLGTGVCLLVERDPIITAKEVASLDLVSGGRIEFGIGAGWNREEMANHGTDPSARFALLAERIEAVKTIWTHDEASYHGRFVDFERIWSWPKPVQSPHPPVHIGGAGPTVLDRVLAHGDGWMPIAGRVADLPGRIAELRERTAAEGRGHVSVSVFGAKPDAGALAALADAGADRCIFWLPPGDAAAVREKLERYAGLMAAL